MDMEFEFDPNKSAANKDKHGIDFIEAQALWQDRRLLIVTARTEHERRFVATGMIRSKHWTAAYTMREGRIRIISVRRARKEEVEYYEGS